MWKKAIIPSLVVALLLLLLPAAMIDTDNLIMYQMQGGSMEPYIDDGEHVVFRTPSHQLFHVEIGDVVVYMSNDTRIGHRVTDIYMKDNVEYVVTKGDANMEPDPPVPASYVEGELHRKLTNPLTKFHYTLVL